MFVLLLFVLLLAIGSVPGTQSFSRKKCAVLRQRDRSFATNCLPAKTSDIAHVGTLSDRHGICGVKYGDRSTSPNRHFAPTILRSFTAEDSV